MAVRDTDFVDTVIIGNGPAALILSYILHGNVPVYTGGHWDSLIDRKLRPCPELLNISPDVYSHLETSIRYSSQALPVNTLLDTLLRPGGDIGASETSCVKWCLDRRKAREHVVLGSAPQTGGQWADNPVSSSWEIGTLSYAEQLSLPGYTFADHWNSTKGEKMPELIRPARSETSSYYAAYPSAVGIANAFRNTERASGISRMYDGFYISSHGLRCKNLVLASGIFNEVIQPPPSMAPLRSLDAVDKPILVVGSGFTAADVIISTPAHRKIIHVFNWDPENRPSPLRACHGQAYPEYAFIYRQMKLAATNGTTKPQAGRKHFPKKLPWLPEFSKRDWSSSYRGFANAFVEHETPKSSEQSSDMSASIKICGKIEVEAQTFDIGGFHFAAGRRGSLTYLDPDLMQELMPTSPPSVPASPRLGPWGESIATSDGLDTSELPFSQVTKGPAQHIITGQTLRPKIRSSADGALQVEVAPNVFAVGSLTGDSLVRFAHGCCCLVAARLLDPSSQVSE